MLLLTAQRVMVSFDFLTLRLRLSVCHSSGIVLAADGVKCAFQTLRLSAFCNCWLMLHDYPS